MKNCFVLTRKNQKGQVALFVALIFQVVFIFFALLINIGLLVHHKINLQQSTDIAAYYGAMKQAEILNVISHVNFQMRQAWKLLVWRYRVFGTFGLQSNPSFPSPIFPMSLVPKNGRVEIQYSVSDSENFRCSSTVNKITDMPFFCIGHSGISGWSTASAEETFCKVSCANLSQIPTQINKISLTSGSSTPYGGNVAKAANQAINSANEKIKDNCEAVGPKSVSFLARIIATYFDEVERKKQLIQVLGSNLSLSADKSLDIEGKKILDGATKTFENNLTEANLQSKSKFELYNGLDKTKASACAFNGNATDGTEQNSATQFLKEIKIKFVQYFVQSCKEVGTRFEYVPYSLFNNNFDKLNSDLRAALIEFYEKQGHLEVVDKIEAALVSSNYILGYEKNPWCQVYTAARAETKPKIPFLPLSAITLSAVSIAKPFGGVIGPWFGQTWQASSPKSDGSPTEEALPIRDLKNGADLGNVIDSKKTVVNYANYIGDEKGLSDSKVVAAYHSMLLHRSVEKYVDGLSYAKETPSVSQYFSKPNTWPAFDSWKNMADIADSSYDYLAMSVSGNKNSGLRDVEISVLAPNQFDLANYSIDADFYNNYYTKLSSSLSSIEDVAGSVKLDPSQFRPDYGYNRNLANNGLADHFSVRHQIQIANQIIKPTEFYNTDFGTNGAATERFEDIFKFIPNSMATLLTGWTFSDFDDYTTFPNQNLGGEYTMSFGKCADDWASDDTSFKSPADDGKLPPAPGNCVTGGRVGYSVKLISPNMVRSGNPQSLGGSASPADILNPIDPSFLSF